MTNHIDDQQVARVATLAALAMDESERTVYRGHLERLLGFVGKLSDVDVSGVEPMAHPLDAQQPLRNDIVTENNHREELLANAPESEDGMFLVPKVIE